MKFFEKVRAAALAIAMAAAVAFSALLPMKSSAQVVTQLPVSLNINAVTDLGNGPTDLLVLQGNAWLFTSQGSGTASTSGSSTTLTFTATPSAFTNPPCVGCQITGAGLTTQTVVAVGTGLTLTLSAVATVPSGSTVSFGSACPSFSSLAGLPPSPNIALQPSAGALPLYTYSRICGYSANGPGATVLPFPIEAH